MSDTEESANISADDDASNEPTVSTTPPSDDNGESAEIQDANVAYNALQSLSTGLRVNSSVEASVSPAADLSSNEHQTASAVPADENLIIDILAYLNVIDTTQPIGTEYDTTQPIGTGCDTTQPIGTSYDTNQQDTSNEIEKYSNESKLHDDLNDIFYRILEKLDLILGPDVVKEIKSLDDEKVMYEYQIRKYSILHDVAQTEAKKGRNFILKKLVLDKLEDELEPEVNYKVNDQNEQKRLAAVQNYKNAIRFFKTDKFSLDSDSTG